MWIYTQDLNSLHFQLMIFVPSSKKADISQIKLICKHVSISVMDINTEDGTNEMQSKCTGIVHSIYASRFHIQLNLCSLYAQTSMSLPGLCYHNSGHSYHHASILFPFDKM